MKKFLTSMFGGEKTVDDEFDALVGQYRAHVAQMRAIAQEYRAYVQATMAASQKSADLSRVVYTFYEGSSLESRGTKYRIASNSMSVAHSDWKKSTELIELSIREYVQLLEGLKTPLMTREELLSQYDRQRYTDKDAPETAQLKSSFEDINEKLKSHLRDILSHRHKEFDVEFCKITQGQLTLHEQCASICSLVKFESEPVLEERGSAASNLFEDGGVCVCVEVESEPVLDEGRGSAASTLFEGGVCEFESEPVLRRGVAGQQALSLRMACVFVCSCVSLGVGVNVGAGSGAVWVRVWVRACACANTFFCGAVKDAPMPENLTAKEPAVDALAGAKDALPPPPAEGTRVEKDGLHSATSAGAMSSKVTSAGATSAAGALVAAAVPPREIPPPASGPAPPVDTSSKPRKPAASATLPRPQAATQAPKAVRSTPGLSARDKKAQSARLPHTGKVPPDPLAGRPRVMSMREMPAIPTNRSLPKPPGGASLRRSSTSLVAPSSGARASLGPPASKPPQTIPHAPAANTPANTAPAARPHASTAVPSTRKSIALFEQLAGAPQQELQPRPHIPLQRHNTVDPQLLRQHRPQMQQQPQQQQQQQHQSQMPQMPQMLQMPQQQPQQQQQHRPQMPQSTASASAQPPAEPSAHALATPPGTAIAG
eukprot:CAMPEP_0177661186 /NCGR_PEP_ID=MMETSP0447-20121125/18515_1 /TAXON_ID=0 /ORGANISM="Stygamoeba regulata, Strain BSH-02190019" /LENGTH=656 /DNA_ID=CAMNT_0019166453 /DNA_START=446 /DNA_END=2416 /DNA_ORIENTATION=-